MPQWCHNSHSGLILHYHCKGRDLLKKVVYFRVLPESIIIKITIITIIIIIAIIIAIIIIIISTFLAALAALYLTLVSQSVGGCHFRILTQRVTFET